MGLPDISGYLASTRQPLDLVGPAIQAFQAISSEMRATRAQNLAEEESARDLGKGIKEGMQSDRMFEENILDMRHQQGIEDQRLAHDKLRIQMDQEMQRFKMEQEFPLEVQYRKAQMAAMAQESRLKAEEIGLKRMQWDIGNANLGLIDSVFSGGTDVPEIAIAEGEDAKSPKARIRWAEAAISSLENGIGKVSGDPLLKMQIALKRQKLETEPLFHEMKQEDDLILPVQKQKRREQRYSGIKVALPGDDAWTAGFIERHWDQFNTAFDAPKETWDEMSKHLVSRASAEYALDLERGGTGPNTVFNMIASAQARMEAAQRAVREAENTPGFDAKKMDNLKVREGEATEYFNSLRNSQGGRFGGILQSFPQGAEDTTWRTFVP